MRDQLVLAIDQGTTNTKAVLVDQLGSVVAKASVRVPLSFPMPGWVESSGWAIWASVQDAVNRCLDTINPGDIAAIGVANQRESVLVWDRATGEPLGPCISWQCRRTADACERLRADGHGLAIREQTGLDIDPMFSATKARWLLDHIVDGRDRAGRGELCIGTLDTWIAWNLSGGEAFITDLTNASRTLLLDLDARRWDEDLLALFGIPAAALPEVRGSNGYLGTTVARGAIRGGIPICALIGDSHGALFGHGAPPAGTVKVTYGTGSSLMVPILARSDTVGLSSTIAWSTEVPVSSDKVVVHALEGNVIATGATLAWLTEVLGIRDEATLGDLAGTVADAGGVVIVPAFSGLGAPHWDADARGLIAGLTRGSTRGHLARAAFESIAYQVRDIVELLREATTTQPVAVIADGGAMQSDFLAQLQADVLDIPVLRSRSRDVSAVGAAYLAGLAIGMWDTIEAIRRLPRAFDTFVPAPSADVRERGYRDWRAALDRARSHPGAVGGAGTAEAVGVEA